MDFCYLVCRSVLNEATLDAIQDALACFHTHRAIFKESGVHPSGFSLPRQHALSHYRHLVYEFSVPNGLCYSIMELKHIKAVKKPWCRSSQFDALGQMLLTNQCSDKLATTHVDFEARGMLNGPCLSHFVQTIPIPIPVPIPTHLVDLQSLADCIGEDMKNADVKDALPSDGPKVQATIKLATKAMWGYPQWVGSLSKYVDVPDFTEHLWHFLHDQIYPLVPISGSDMDISNCPTFDS